jgi:hypothetical protein
MDLKLYKYNTNFILGYDHDGSPGMAGVCIKGFNFGCYYKENIWTRGFRRTQGSVDIIVNNNNIRYVKKHNLLYFKYGHKYTCLDLKNKHIERVSFDCFNSIEECDIEKITIKGI